MKEKRARIDGDAHECHDVSHSQLIDYSTPRKKNNKKKKNRKKNKAKQNGQIRADTEVVSATLDLKNGRFPSRRNKTVGKHETQKEGKKVEINPVSICSHPSQETQS